VFRRETIIALRARLAAFRMAFDFLYPNVGSARWRNSERPPSIRPPRHWRDDPDAQLLIIFAAAMCVLGFLGAVTIALSHG
jgi:hypothetical protein